MALFKEAIRLAVESQHQAEKTRTQIETRKGDTIRYGAYLLFCLSPNVE